MNNESDNERKETWWRDWFNHVYMDVYAHRSEDAAAAEVGAVRSVLPLQSHHRILDLCCGNGRHCRALRGAGLHDVTGIDYSMPLLEHAVSESKRPQYARGDMRLLPLRDDSVDAVLSFFTSFGYFSTNVENLAVLHEIARVLRSKGYFLLDYLNPAHVREHYVPESVKTHGEYVIREKRSISSDGERIEKEIVIENWGDGDHRYHESVRLYEREEMADMLESADLRVDGVLGAFDGSSFDSGSPRMILHGVRM